MKDNNWFKFYPVQWLAGAISLGSLATQGAFIRLCCLAWPKGGEVKASPALFRHLGIKQDGPEWAEMLDLEVIHVKDGYIRIEFMTEQHQEICRIRAQNSANASHRWNMRAHKSAMRNDATAMRPQCDRNAKRCNKKEKENENEKENINAGAGAPAKPAALPEKISTPENERLFQAWIEMRELNGDKIHAARRDTLILRLTRLGTPEKVKTSLENALARNSRDFYDPTPPAKTPNLPTGQIHQSALPADFKFRSPGDED